MNSTTRQNPSARVRAALSFFIMALSLHSIDATATNKPTQEQDQKQYQGQDQYQGQETNVSVIVGGEAGPLATAAGGSLTINEAERPDDITIRNTPNVYAPPAMPTSPCRIGGSGGASGAGIGLSFGGSKMDWECNTRETADAFARMGMPALGLMMLCRTEAVTNELGKGGAGFSSEDCESFVRTYQANSSRDGEQDQRIEDLTRQIAIMQEDAERCRQETDEKIDRAFETCVGK